MRGRVVFHLCLVDCDHQRAALLQNCLTLLDGTNMIQSCVNCYIFVVECSFWYSLKQLNIILVYEQFHISYCFIYVCFVCSAESALVEIWSALSTLSKID